MCLTVLILLIFMYVYACQTSREDCIKIKRTSLLSPAAARHILTFAQLSCCS